MTESSPRQPLYLRRQSLVIEQDGPALRISAPGRAVVYYPLQRLSRVVVIGCPTFSTAALLACADAGVSVTFVRRDGSPRACALGERDVCHGIAARLADVLQQDDGLDRYRDWYRHQLSLARRVLAWRLGLPPTVNRHRLALVLADAEVVPRALLSGCEIRLQGFARGLALELLSDHGLRGTQLRDLGIDLVDDVADLLVGDLALPLRHWLDGDGAVDDGGLVAFFEGRQGRLRRLGERIMAQLRGWLGG